MIEALINILVENPLLLWLAVIPLLLTVISHLRPDTPGEYPMVQGPRMVGKAVIAVAAVILLILMLMLSVKG